MKTILLLPLFLIYQLIIPAYAVNFDYKNVSNFPPLRDFSSVELFEKNYREYTQICLDNTYGGTAGRPCYLANKMWDRELNFYYNKLYLKLNKTQQFALKTSQRVWLNERDKSFIFSSSLIEMKYAHEEGTMFLLMQTADSNNLVTSIVKQRALQLKMWLKYLETDLYNKE